MGEWSWLLAFGTTPVNCGRSNAYDVTRSSIKHNSYGHQPHHNHWSSCQHINNSRPSNQGQSPLHIMITAQGPQPKTSPNTITPFSLDFHGHLSCGMSQYPLRWPLTLYLSVKSMVFLRLKNKYLPYDVSHHLQPLPLYTGCWYRDTTCSEVIGRHPAPPMILPMHGSPKRIAHLHQSLCGIVYIESLATDLSLHYLTPASTTLHAYCGISSCFSNNTRRNNQSFLRGLIHMGWLNTFIFPTHIVSIPLLYSHYNLM